MKERKMSMSVSICWGIQPFISEREIIITISSYYQLSYILPFRQRFLCAHLNNKVLTHTLASGRAIHVVVL